MKYTLPISPEYVSGWGLWEAVREIYQNALDEGGAKMVYYEFDNSLSISTETGHLTPQSLVLGTSSKRADETKRGKFGEGYKLALLVLARMQFPVQIHNGAEFWMPQLEHDDQFNTDVLTIHVEGIIPTHPGVVFSVSGVTQQQYEDIQSNILMHEDIDRVLEEPAQAGRIYVGGLYVATVPRFKCGYSFRPGVVKLDRDRGMVDGFDLAYATSRLWTERGHSARLSELLEAEAPDVEYVESHAANAQNFVSDHYNYYVARHAYAVPVSTQDEIQRATAAGLTWVLVPEKVKVMLHRVKSWFIPDSKPLLAKMKEFQNSYRYYLPTEGQRRLEEIIKSIEPQETK